MPIFKPIPENDAKGKVKEAEKAVRRAGKLVDELSDMV